MNVPRKILNCSNHFSLVIALLQTYGEIDVINFIDFLYFIVHMYMNSDHFQKLAISLALLE